MLSKLNNFIACFSTYWNRFVSSFISADSTDTIESSLNEIASKTCVKFERHDKEKHWIKFIKKTG